MIQQQICLVSDIHFGVKKNSEVYFNSQKKFLVDQLIPYLKEKCITKIYFLGDIFDNRNSINTKIQNEVFNIFNDHFRDFEITILVGNHDCYFNNSIEINSVKFLGKFENIEIIEEPKIETINGKKILLVPWIVDFNKFIIDIGNKEFDASFGHYNIKGFHYNKFKTSEDGLDGSLFGNKCKKVFSGHFHIRSKQTFLDCDIVYIGSPYQLTRNDVDEARAVIMNLFCPVWRCRKYKYVCNTVFFKYV